MNWFKKYLYGLIRPLFVKDIDPNENFKCGFCGKPVLKRILYCSSICSDLDIIEETIVECVRTSRL